MFFEQVINGLTIGSIYALVAIGYTLVFGVLELVNFANGSVYLLGGYLALMTYLAWGGYFWVCLLLAVVCCGLVGLGLDFFALKRLRSKNAPKLAGLITTMGVSTVIDNVILLFFGSETKSYPNMITLPSLKIGSVTVSSNQLVILGVAVVLMVLLSILTYKTKLGKAMRCTSQNMNAAKLMGINTQAIISLTFVISSALAAIAGVLVGMYYQTIDISSGFVVGMKTMASAVLGGVGVLPGAMLGGLIIGVVETLGASYFNAGYRNAYAFIILIVIILIKPSGILGKEKVTKV